MVLDCTVNFLIRFDWFGFYLLCFFRFRPFCFLGAVFFPLSFFFSPFPFEISQRNRSFEKLFIKQNQIVEYQSLNDSNAQCIFQSFRQSWKQEAIYPNSSKGKDLQYLRLHTSVANQNSVEEGVRGRGGEVRALGTRGENGHLDAQLCWCS